MADLSSLVALGQTLGYENEELARFVTEERERIKVEREKKLAEDRERAQWEEKAFERNQRATELEHKRKVELLKLEIEVKRAEAGGQNGGISHLRPRLALYKEGDEIEPFISKFERVALQYQMEDTEKAVQFMNSFDGKALAILARLDVEASYEEMKDSLIKAYGLTTDKARNRFFTARLGDKETAAQFLVRLSGYLDRWVEKDGTPDTKEGFRDLMIRAQLEKSAPPELTAQFKLSVVKTAEEMVTTADAFFEAHGYDKRVKAKQAQMENKNENSNQEQVSRPRSPQGKKPWWGNSNKSRESGGPAQGRNDRFHPPRLMNQGNHRQSPHGYNGGTRQQVNAAAIFTQRRENRLAVSPRKGSAPVALAGQLQKRCRPETTFNEGTRDNNNSRCSSPRYESAPAASGDGAHELF